MKIQVRPPRIKKSSMSSSVNTEDEHSSSSPCSNVIVTEKTSRLTKISEIKAEDVLEGRSRRLMSPTRVNDNGIYARRAENNSSSASSRLEVRRFMFKILIHFLKNVED